MKRSRDNFTKREYVSTQKVKPNLCSYIENSDEKITLLEYFRNRELQVKINSRLSSRVHSRKSSVAKNKRVRENLAYNLRAKRISKALKENKFVKLKTLKTKKENNLGKLINF